MKTYIEPQKEIPIIDKYDVIVAGGGCAGFAAAVAAARNGAKTLIIERFPFFGGTATASLMANIVGFRNQVEPDGLQVTKGIGEELILKLLEMEGAVKSRNAYPSKKRSDTKGDLSYNYAFDTEKFKYITLKMVVESNCDILFHTWFSDVIMDGNIIKGIIVENKSGRQAIMSDVVIDATGDGDAAFHAGVPFWHTKKDEAPRLNESLMYKITGFNKDTKAGGCLIDDTMVLWGPAAGPANGADAKELTDMEISARLAVYDDLKKRINEDADLQNSNIVDTGALIGIRQTRFFEGVYKITGEDVLSGARFDDSIAMGVNPVIHYYGYRRFLKHQGYEIPYRVLLPKEVDGLLFCGRCLSSDQIAYESWRAMAHILAIGEGAGTAAALAVKSNVSLRNVNIKALQKQLIMQGSEIGQNNR